MWIYPLSTKPTPQSENAGLFVKIWEDLFQQLYRKTSLSDFLRSMAASPQVQNHAAFSINLTNENVLNFYPLWLGATKVLNVICYMGYSREIYYHIPCDKLVLEYLSPCLLEMFNHHAWYFFNSHKTSLCSPISPPSITAQAIAGIIAMKWTNPLKCLFHCYWWKGHQIVILLLFVGDE